MKKLTIILAVMITAMSGYGQIISVNGTNTPEVLTPEVRSYLVELTVDTLGLVYRADKDTSGPVKQSDLDNVIALSNEMKSSGKVLAVCYTVMTKEGQNVSYQIAGFDALVAGGVYIYSVRLGNETWAKAAGGGKRRTFEQYWVYCEPYIQLFVDRGVKKILIPVARPADQVEWNTVAAAKINSSELYQPDYHPYWGPNQAKVLDTLGLDETLETANLSTYAPFQDWFYQTLYEQVMAYDLIGEFREWHESNLPTKEIHITEFGPPTAVGHISNAIGFDATTDWFFNAIRANDVKFVARFNGPSPTGTAIISPRGKKDVQGGSAYVKRLAYYTIYNVIRHKNAQIYPTINASGTYVVSAQNMTRAAQNASNYFNLSEGYEVSSVEFSGVTGINYYSGSGTIEWWAKDSPKTYQISGITTTQTEEVPALSYGYLTVTVTKVEVYGCTDAAATNYNPDATINDGSCTYPVCLQKRWLFKNMPCKVSKSKNCNCN